MAQRNKPFLWESLSMEIRLDIILSEVCRSRNWAVISVWTHERRKLMEAMENRGIVWNKNIDIDPRSQHAYIQTATMDIKRNCPQIKQALLSLLTPPALRP